MTLKLLSLLALALSLSSCSRTPDPVCAELDQTIDANIKKIALTLVDGEVSDKGAMQQAARYTMVNNRLLVIATNLEIQSKNNCAIRKTPIDPLAFEEAALKCFSATLTDKKEAVAVCDLKTWKANKK